jgi:hypothetical protein
MARVPNVSAHKEDDMNRMQKSLAVASLVAAALAPVATDAQAWRGYPGWGPYGGYPYWGGYPYYGGHPYWGGPWGPYYGRPWGPWRRGWW